jgi:hypothetical protein
MTSVHHLFASVRAQGDALLATSADPHAELLAMVWGSRFDREHAQLLLARQTLTVPGALQSVMAAADSFDELPVARQHRLRRVIARHRASGPGGCDAMAAQPVGQFDVCHASC